MWHCGGGRLKVVEDVQRRTACAIGGGRGRAQRGEQPRKAQL